MMSTVRNYIPAGKLARSDQSFNLSTIDVVDNEIHVTQWR